MLGRRPSYKRNDNMSQKASFEFRRERADSCGGLLFWPVFFVAPMFLTWQFPEISGQKHGKLLFWMFQKKTTEVIRIWWLAIQVLSILYPIGIHQDGYGDSKEPSVSPEAVHALLGKD